MACLCIRGRHDNKNIPYDLEEVRFRAIRDLKYLSKSGNPDHILARNLGSMLLHMLVCETMHPIDSLIPLQYQYMS